jgi:hypothetical protein
MKEDSSLDVADAKKIERQVIKAIKTDHSAGLLDLTIVTAEAGDEEVDDQDRQSGETDVSSDEVDSYKVPKVPIWYYNAVTGEAWNQASPEQKAETEKYKMESDKAMKLADGPMLVDGEIVVEGDTEETRVARLETVLKFVNTLFDAVIWN